MTDTASLEFLVKRDRLWVVAALVGVTALAWIYLLAMARMQTMDLPTAMETMGVALTTGRVSSWTVTDFIMMFLMWAIMMVGMMLPSAAPMILLFTLVNRRKQSRGRGITSPAVFASGYLTTWTAFSGAATALQWMLHHTGQLSPMMMTTSAIVGGTVLVAAGVYQWTPLKARCLHHCQSPLFFLSTHWRDGALGAFLMGWHHGLYCLGCCWFLMGLLFVGGVMNLLWIAGLAAFVLVEKVWPARWVPLVSGGLLVVWGVAVLAGGA